MAYTTGGPIPGKAGKHLPGAHAEACSIDAASEGTANNPNASWTPSGLKGQGSSGGASTSKPR